MQPHGDIDDSDILLRLPDVLRIVPMSRAAWYAGVKEGKLPQPIKLSERIVTWRKRDILAYIESHAQQPSAE
jgi:prophage regulatory protein